MGRPVAHELLGKPDGTHMGPTTYVCQMTEADDQLKVEIEWCLARLEEKLADLDPYSKQAQEAAKVHRILKSSKAPVIKKRQAMRNMFGDYREKMKAAEKKKLQAMKKSKLVPVKDTPPESKFLRLSSGAAQIHKSSEGALSAAASAVSQLSVTESSEPANRLHPLSGKDDSLSTLPSVTNICTDSSTENGEFQFDFNKCEKAVDNNGSLETSTDNVPVNYFVLKPALEEFHFDFESITPE